MNTAPPRRARELAPVSTGARPSPGSSTGPPVGSDHLGEALVLDDQPWLSGRARSRLRGRRRESSRAPASDLSSALSRSAPRASRRTGRPPTSTTRHHQRERERQPDPDRQPAHERLRPPAAGSRRRAPSRCSSRRTGGPPSRAGSARTRRSRSSGSRSRSPRRARGARGGEHVAGPAHERLEQRELLRRQVDPSSPRHAWRVAGSSRRSPTSSTAGRSSARAAPAPAAARTARRTRTASSGSRRRRRRGPPRGPPPSRARSAAARASRRRRRAAAGTSRSRRCPGSITSSTTASYGARRHPQGVLAAPRHVHRGALLDQTAANQRAIFTSSSTISSRTRMTMTRVS